MTGPLRARARDQRGVAFPSPLVLLSVAAVGLAGIAFVATNNDDRPDQARQTTESSAPTPDPTPTEKPSKPIQAEPRSEKPEKPEPAKPKKAEKTAKAEKTGQPDEPVVEPVVDRAAVYVEVYNNSGISGLAGSTASTASGVGWQVVGSDNWYGTIPASTVYYPPRLQEAATMLARDLGISRTRPAIDPMRFDRLTVILTADYT